MALDTTTRRTAKAGLHAPFTQLIVDKLAELKLRPEGPVPSTATQDIGTAQRGAPQLLDGPALQDFYAKSLCAIEAEASRVAGRPQFSIEETFLAGCCMVSAPNLEKAIDRASRFYAALARAAGTPGCASMKLRVGGPDAELRFYSAGSGPAASASFMSALLGGAFHVKLLSWLIGDEVKLSSAATSYHRLISQEALTEIFPWPLSFSANLGPNCDFSVTFSSRYLQRPVVKTGVDLESLNEIDLLFTLPPHVSVALAIRRIFLVALSRGVRLPSTARLAALCNRSAATLRRHLARDGTSIRTIREECVRECALQLLQDRRMLLGEVAVRLGFSDAPCFRRAFRRWTGSSPSAYRRRPGVATLA